MKYSLFLWLFGCAVYLNAQLRMLPEYVTRWSTVCLHAVSVCDVSVSACLQLTCLCSLLFDSLTVWRVWQMQLRILPESVHKMDYNLYPLLSGLVALPRLKLTVSDRSDVPIRQPQLTELLDRSLPSHVFVMVSMSGFIVYVLVLHSDLDFQYHSCQEWGFHNYNCNKPVSEKAIMQDELWF